MTTTAPSIVLDATELPARREPEVDYRPAEVKGITYLVTVSPPEPPAK